MLPNGPPLFLGSPCSRLALTTARELQLSMPEIGEKERNYLFKSFTDLRVITNVFIKIPKSLKTPTNTHSPSFPLCLVQGTVSQEKK